MPIPGAVRAVEPRTWVRRPTTRREAHGPPQRPPQTTRVRNPSSPPTGPCQTVRRERPGPSAGPGPPPPPPGSRRHPPGAHDRVALLLSEPAPDPRGLRHAHLAANRLDRAVGADGLRFGDLQQVWCADVGHRLEQLGVLVAARGRVPPVPAGVHRDTSPYSARSIRSYVRQPRPSRSST